MNGIFDKITSVDNLFAAWCEFRGGKRGKYDVQCFERALEDNIFALHQDLASGAYRHGAYHRFCVYDPKYRVIHKATVRDRLLHHAIVRVITPLFERSFIYDSYSCRRGKGTHVALRRLELFLRCVSRNYTKPCFALKIDVRKFFDSVDHEILLNILARRISCPLTQNLLAEIVNSYSQTKIALGGVHLTDGRPRGIPIGSVTSQLFANVYLDAFDHFIKEKMKVRCYLRYTDDMCFISSDRDYLATLPDVLQEWLWKNRRLELHPHKIILTKFARGVDWLGWVHLPWHRVLRTKTKSRMLKRLLHSSNPDQMQSYLGLLRHGNMWQSRKGIVSRIEN